MWCLEWLRSVLGRGNDRPSEEICVVRTRNPAGYFVSFDRRTPILSKDLMDACPMKRSKAEKVARKLALLGAYVER